MPPHYTPAPTSPTSSPKLPKFLQRDRSKSVNSPSPSSDGESSGRHARKSGKFLSKQQQQQPAPDTASSPPPPTPAVNIPRAQTRPLSDSHSSATSSPSHYAVAGPGGGSIPSRLSGWFAHTFTGSTTDLSLPSLLAASPRKSTSSISNSISTNSAGGRIGRNALLTAAKTGKGHLDKAVRYLLDSDSAPDRCGDPIWLLGVEHSGWDEPPTVSSPPSSYPAGGRRGSGDKDFRSSTSSLDSTHNLNKSKDGKKEKDPSANWPADFYDDFTSRVWLTYRSQFVPIRDGSLGDLGSPCSLPDPSVLLPAAHNFNFEGRRSGSGSGSQISHASTTNSSKFSHTSRGSGGGWDSASDSNSNSPTSTLKKWSNWGREGRGWTSDSGWGCMLRTGQSLLANALVNVHLGRDWRRPHAPTMTSEYATYVRILTWFFDTPSPHAPFSVHRLALAGKELGTDVGQWFGPSVAARAIEKCVNMFELGDGPGCAMGVCVAGDGGLVESEVRQRSGGRGQTWGQRPVLCLIGIRLGLDGVNPIYYETIKQLYTFPQSVGIAGGRPSSSYYFVGSQAENLFYLDPHHARPTIPLRLPSDVEREDSELTLADLSPLPSPRSPSSPDPTYPSELDPLEMHYAIAYSSSELRTFHCERVRKMPLSGLDPSMLIGFLVKDEAEWRDLRTRVAGLSKTIIGIVDEPPRWEKGGAGWDEEEEEGLGMESIADESESDDELDDDANVLDGIREEQDRRKSTSTTGTHGESSHDTEEDPVDPITPLPGGRFVIPDVPKAGVVVEALDDMEDDEWDEVSPVSPSESNSHSQFDHLPHAPQSHEPRASPPSHTPSSSQSSASIPIPPIPKKKKKKKERAVPVPMVKFPGDGVGGDYDYSSTSSSAGETQFVGERQRRQSIKLPVRRGKDGGRTTSGGVKGVLMAGD